MSAFGPKRTCPCAVPESAFDPKRTRRVGMAAFGVERRLGVAPSYSVSNATSVSLRAPQCPAVSIILFMQYAISMPRWIFIGDLDLSSAPEIDTLDLGELKIT